MRRDITIKEYPANIQIFIEGDCYDISTDGWDEYCDYENIDGVIDKLENYVKLTDEEIEYIKEKIHPYVEGHSIDDSIWYAVERNADDNDWGTGSYNYDEAIQMAREYGEEARIAVIREDNDPICIKVIRYEDF